MAKIKNKRILRRKKRVSSNIVGSEKMPRISVFRSNRYMFVQAIDDGKRLTMASYSSMQLKKDKDYKKDKKAVEAKQIGIKLGAIMKDKKLTSAVFDRGRYAYNGRVKALAEGLRESGVKI